MPVTNANLLLYEAFSAIKIPSMGKQWDVIIRGVA